MLTRRCRSVQVWHFLGSFCGLLDLTEVPSFAALEAALAGGPTAVADPLLRAAVLLTRLLVADVYHVASEELVEPEGDVVAQQRDLQAGTPIVTARSWSHAAAAVFAGAPPPLYPSARKPCLNSVNDFRKYRMGSMSARTVLHTTSCAHIALIRIVPEVVDGESLYCSHGTGS